MHYSATTDVPNPAGMGLAWTAVFLPYSLVLVRLLLENVSNAALDEYTLSTALQLASENDHRAVVKLKLLQE